MEAISEREQKVLGIIETARGKRARFRDAQITMAHGAGGKATQTLIEGLFVPALGSGTLEQMGDSGGIEVAGAKLAMTTDSFVVKPLRFPGGSIGELAVNGTVNDLAMAGARPLAITLSLILEEGLDSDVLRGEVEAVTSAITAPRSCSRAASSSSTRRSSPIPARCGLLRMPCSRRSVPICDACATRRAAALPPCSTSSPAPPTWQ